MKLPCPGCGGLFEPSEGPVHRDMTSSPGCWQRYCEVLAREYSDPQLMVTHRLSVDTYAVQHPGEDSRQAIQSVGLHLARLMLQVEDVVPAASANAVMLGLGSFKASLPRLQPPALFHMTVMDVPLTGSAAEHASTIRLWARQTWEDWREDHGFVREWVNDHLKQSSR